MVNVQHQNHTPTKQKIYQILPYQYVNAKFAGYTVCMPFFDTLLPANYFRPIYVTGNILNNMGNSYPEMPGTILT